MQQGKFRFGIQATLADSSAAWAQLARTAEQLGYDVLALPDHFVPQFAPSVALAAAAAVTSRLRLSSMVWCNDYRHPVVLAKELATLDVLSDGRLEIGLGAGWMKSDYEAAGMPYDTPGVRLDRLQEAIAILRGLFGEGPFSFSGRHYTIRSMDAKPKPLQRPHPRFVIGGGGRRMLSIAAREADSVGINMDLRQGEINAAVFHDAVRQSIDQKVQWVREAAGDRLPSLEIGVMAFLLAVTPTRRKVAEQFGASIGMSPDDMLAAPFALLGTVDEICADLQERRERWGMSYITVSGEHMKAFAPVVERLAGT